MNIKNAETPRSPLTRREAMHVQKKNGTVSAKERNTLYFSSDRQRVT